MRLTSIFGGTAIHDLLLQKYNEEDFLYVGTSAGAACASKNMIYQGSSHEALLKGEIKITSGLGFIDNVIIPEALEILEKYKENSPYLINIHKYQYISLRNNFTKRFAKFIYSINDAHCILEVTMSKHKVAYL
mgnify:CR=1 FL=1